jgi:hypothetical protein
LQFASRKSGFLGRRVFCWFDLVGFCWFLN